MLMYEKKSYAMKCAPIDWNEKKLLKIRHKTTCSNSTHHGHLIINVLQSHKIIDSQVKATLHSVWHTFHNVSITNIRTSHGYVRNINQTYSYWKYYFFFSVSPVVVCLFFVPLLLRFVLISILKPFDNTMQGFLLRFSHLSHFVYSMIR